jgi:hypothetical protein
MTALFPIYAGGFRARDREGHSGRQNSVTQSLTPLLKCDYVVKKWDLLKQGPRADKANYQTVDKTVKWSIPILKDKRSPFGSILCLCNFFTVTE